MDNDPIGSALQSRRIPHGRGKGSKTKGRGTFNPLRALGRYEMDLGLGNDAESWLEIHDLTSNDDGLIATLGVAGKLQGICILAGSRRGLASIVQHMDAPSSDEDDGEQTSNDDDDEGDDEERDERINRRIRNFEKNSFRNPKFWMNWKARVQTATDGSQRVERNAGYIVFDGNDCQTFEGTVSCAALSWNNVKMIGRKTRPRPTPCPTSWRDLDDGEEEGDEGEEEQEKNAGES